MSYPDNRCGPLEGCRVFSRRWVVGATVPPPLPRDYLDKIEHAAFPLRVEEPYDIGCIHVLRAAGLVEAAVTPSVEPGKDYELERMRREGGGNVSSPGA